MQHADGLDPDQVRDGDLIADAHLRLEAAIRGLVEAGASATDSAEVRDQLRRRARMILNALDADKLSSEARELITGHPGPVEPLPGLTEGCDSGFRDIGPWSPDSLIPGSLQDLASQIQAANQQSRNQNPENRAEGHSTNWRNSGTS